MTDSRLNHLMTSNRVWLTDGGLETSIIFLDGIDLPMFASFHLLENDEGRRALQRYFEQYVTLAKAARTGFVLDTATWRSGAFWASLLNRTEEEMATVTKAATSYAVEMRNAHESVDTPIIVNGVLGPAGDGYQPAALWAPEDAQALHAKQIVWMKEAGAEMVSAVTITHAGEAIGIVRAAQNADIPVVIGFTVETDGHLPTGQSLPDAIAETDAATDAAPLYYMVNCAHPDHFSGRLYGDWTDRIGAIRANASRMSHEELDAAEELDDGHPEEFGAQYADLQRVLKNLRVVGGCCGTDHRHVACVAHNVIA